MRKIFVTTVPINDPQAAAAIAQGVALGATEIIHGIVPASLSALGVSGPGYFEVSEPPPPVPAEVRQAQARRALLAAGLLDDVEAAVAASSQDIQIAWEYEPNIRRDSPMIAALAPAIGLTDAQIDDLFRAAAAIV
jgi:hypothetical protein